MGLRGPPKKPNHLRVISGTAPRDTPPEAPAIAQDQAILELPKPPFPMPNDYAQAEWDKIGTALVDRGMLSDERLMILATYCAVSGKIAQKFAAGDVPSAHLLAQQRANAKELGIIGTQGPRDDAAKPAKTSRLAQLKERARSGD
jgi:hypothetical protein